MANIDYPLKPRIVRYRSRFEELGFGSSAVPQLGPYRVRANRDYGAGPQVFDTRYGAFAPPVEISKGGYRTNVMMRLKGVGARVSVGKALVTGPRLVGYHAEACLKQVGFQ